MYRKMYCECFVVCVSVDTCIGKYVVKVLLCVRVMIEIFSICIEKKKFYMYRNFYCESLVVCVGVDTYIEKYIVNVLLCV